MRMTKMKNKSVTMGLISKNGKKIPVQISNINGYIQIEPKGYGDACSNNGHGTPIVLDFYDEKFKIYVWGDIGEQEPKIISLEKALESKRKK